jgi:hypothetical protein
MADDNRAERALEAIPFRHLIGAPLTAVIEAQAQAAQTTVEFIQKVGFKNGAEAGGTTEAMDAGEVRTVNFSYEKTGPDGTTGTATLNVPVLSIIPVPFIRVEEATIDFTAKIVDVVTEDVKTSLNWTNTVDGKYGSFLSPVKVGFKSTLSLNHNRNSNSKFEKEYNMHVTVRAVQDDMPAGLAKVLGILETLIKEKPASA